MGQHVMVDLETLSTGNNAVLLSLGAVKFDPNRTGQHDTTEVPVARISDAIYIPIDPASCQAYGMEIDARTVMWWFDPDRNEPRDQIAAGEMLDLPSALDGFSRWFGNVSVPVWGNGATFDNVILRNAFKAIGYKPPWGYNHDRCFRTLKNLAPLVDTPRVGTGHNALDDATWQAHHLQDIVTELGLRVS